MNASCQQALSNARTSPSTANYSAIYNGFASKGIAFDDIKPRENVFTLQAWNALGRHVKSGEHGVSITTWVPMFKKDEQGVSQPIGRKPRTTSVFHVSQTEPRAGYSEGLWQYALAQGVDGEVKHECAPTSTPRNPPESHTPDSGYYSTEFTPIA